MANVLKKLSAFVPTMEDTVGNFEPAAATKAPSTLSQAPVAAAPEPAVKEMSRAAPAVDVDLTAVSTDLGEPDTAKPKGVKSKPRTTAGRREQTDATVTLRTKDGGIDGRSLKRTGRYSSLAVKLTFEMTDAMKLAAYEEGITLSELTEQMWAAYLARRQSQGSRR